MPLREKLLSDIFENLLGFVVKDLLYLEGVDGEVDEVGEGVEGVVVVEPIPPLCVGVAGRVENQRSADPGSLKLGYRLGEDSPRMRDELQEFGSQRGLYGGRQLKKKFMDISASDLIIYGIY